MMGRDRWDRIEKRDKAFWLLDSFMTICSLLKEGSAQSCNPSIIVHQSPSLPVCFSIIPSTWRPICIGSIHYSLQPSLNLPLSKAIHCILSASCQSRPLQWPERQLDRQVQSSIYLSLNLCQPAGALTCLCCRTEALASNQPRCPKSQTWPGSHSFHQWQETWCYLSHRASGCHFLVDRL